MITLIYNLKKLVISKKNLNGMILFGLVDNYVNRIFIFNKNILIIKDIYKNKKERRKHFKSKIKNKKSIYILLFFL